MAHFERRSELAFETEPTGLFFLQKQTVVIETVLEREVRLSPRVCSLSSEGGTGISVWFLPASSLVASRASCQALVFSLGTEVMLRNLSPGF